MTLTNRQKMLMRAALSYALSNIDDVNEAFADDDGIKVGDETGSEFSEAEVEALKALVEADAPTTANPTVLTTTADGVRAFRGSFLVAIVESEADEDFDEDEDDEDEDDENGDDGPEPVTLDALKDYLKDALTIDIDTEEYGNPVGFQSAELVWDTLAELPPDEVARLYNK